MPFPRVSRATWTLIKTQESPDKIKVLDLDLPSSYFVLAMSGSILTLRLKASCEKVQSQCRRKSEKHWYAACNSTLPL